MRPFLLLLLLAACYCLFISAETTYKSDDELQHFYANEDVTVTMENYILDGNAVYVDFGDGTTVAWSSTEEATHVYSAAGNYTLTIYYCSGTTGTTPVPTCDDVYSPFTRARVEVHERDLCYRLHARAVGNEQASSLAINNGASIAVFIEDPTGALDSATLAKMYQSIGFDPTVEPTNSSVTVTDGAFDEGHGCWNYTVTSSQQAPAVHVELTLRAPGYNHGSCLVGSTVIHLTLINALSFDDFGHLPGTATSRIAQDIVSKGFIPTSLGVATHPCTPAVGIVWMTGGQPDSTDPGYDTTIRGLGTLVWTTMDGFDTVTPIDLARVDELDILTADDLDTSIDNSTSICVSSSIRSCLGMEIYSISFVGGDYSMIALTSEGPVFIQSPIADEAEALHATLTVANFTSMNSDILTTLDGRMSTVPYEYASLRVAPYCPTYGADSTSMVTLVVGGSDEFMMYSAVETRYYAVPTSVSFADLTDDERDEYQVHAQSDIDLSIAHTVVSEPNSWTAVAIPSTLALGEQTILDAVYSVGQQAFFFLTKDSSDERRVLQAYQVEGEDDTTSEQGHWVVSAGFGDHTVVGIELSGPSLLAYGEHVWASWIGDLVFHVQVNFPAGVLVETLVTQQNEPYLATAIDSDGLLYVLRPPMPGVGAVGPTAAGILSYPLCMVGFAAATLTVEMPAAYTGVSGDYPLGILSDVDSLAVNPFKVVSIPYGALLLDITPSSATRGISWVPDILPASYHDVMWTPMNITSGLQAEVDLDFTIAYTLTAGEWSSTIIGVDGRFVETSHDFDAPVAATTHPALLADLAPTFTSATGDTWPAMGDAAVLTLDISALAAADQVGWTGNCVGMTVHFKTAGAIIVTEIVSQTVANGVIVFPGQLSRVLGTTVEPGRWTLFAGNVPSNVAALSLGQALTVSAPAGSPPVQTLTLSGDPLSTFTWDDADVGYIVEIDGERAIITAIGSSTVATTLQTGATALTAGAYTLTDSLTVSPPADSVRPHISTADAALASGEVTIFTGVESSQVTLTLPDTPFIDKGASVVITSTLRPENSIIALSDPNNFSVAVKATSTGTNITLTNNGDVANTQVAVYQLESSLHSTGGRATASFIAACPPQDGVVFDTGMTDAELLDVGSSTTNVELLPTNYRPPSKYGVAVPTTDNIYNGDPSTGMYLTTESQSTSTGEYKQCAGASDRAGCGCTDAQTISDNINYSDCVDRAFRWYYGDQFTPSFIRYTNGVGSAMTSSYFLKELNGRIDYCIDPDGDNVCSSQSSQEAYLLDYDTAIKFAGEGLYHFKIYIQGDTFCNMTSFMKVWIYEPPTREVIRYMQYSITAFIMATLVFGSYLINLKVNGRRFK
ncbi:Cation channel sperm-associated protein subunit beta [Carpediemonas membranifera]|uniref:Cation channel sperm-associated protein subunit beta n=1 Tax=Carpediemonas membranifera TaxID=201153 RepID=A0A8J6E4N3_9EUKA|nr:Cation channel sperm-associated protein subunit beta [Carpediemonas membranifera]|eukprot:KAG9397166.1 Cation channel sperm-associated protein subunit beta [Carpediemonas membranifera]